MKNTTFGSGKLFQEPGRFYFQRSFARAIDESASRSNAVTLLWGVLRLDFGLGSLRRAGHCLESVLQTFFEGFQIQVEEAGRNGIYNRIANSIGVKKVRNCSEEADHDGIKYHALTKLFGDASSGDAIDLQLLANTGDSHEILLNNKDAAIFQFGDKSHIGLLRHHYENVRLGDVGIKYGRVGQNELGAAGTAASFRSEILRHGGIAALIDRCGFTEDNGRKNHALAAKACDANFC